MVLDKPNNFLDDGFYIRRGLAWIRSPGTSVVTQGLLRDDIDFPSLTLGCGRP
jgi:hypothetical protein